NGGDAAIVEKLDDMLQECRADPLAAMGLIDEDEIDPRHVAEHAGTRCADRHVVFFRDEASRWLQFELTAPVSFELIPVVLCLHPHGERNVGMLHCANVHGVKITKVAAMAIGHSPCAISAPALNSIPK